MTSESGKLNSATIKHIAEGVVAFSSSAIKAEIARELPGVAQYCCNISGARDLQRKVCEEKQEHLLGKDTQDLPRWQRLVTGQCPC